MTNKRRSMNYRSSVELDPVGTPPPKQTGAGSALRKTLAAFFAVVSIALAISLAVAVGGSTGTAGGSGDRDSSGGTTSFGSPGTTLTSPPSATPSPASPTVSPAPGGTPAVQPTVGPPTVGPPPPSGSVDYNSDYKVTVHDVSGHDDLLCDDPVCTTVVEPDGPYRVDGSNGVAQPGDTYCMRGGDHGSMEVRHVAGSAEQPVTFVNCEGAVHFGDGGTPLRLTNVTHARFVGNGDSTHLYGFTVKSDSSFAIAWQGKSRDIEMAWFHLYELTGFAGLGAKCSRAQCSDPSDPVTGDTPFVQTGTHLHHNLVNYSLDAEGFYISHFECLTGSDEFRLRGVYVHDNVFLNMGAEAFQIGCAVDDVKIYNNFANGTGLRPFENRSDQTGGFQFGTALVYNNWIERVAGNAMHFQGGDASPSGEYLIHFYNNTVVNPGSYGYFNVRLTDSTTTLKIRLENNTFLAGPETKGFRFNNNLRDAPFEIVNNHFEGVTAEAFLLVDSGDDYDPVTWLTDLIFDQNTFA